ncbi:MAG: phospho-sugar mutase [Bacteroidota bacterium]
MDVLTKAQKWLDSNQIDDTTKSEIRRLMSSSDDTQLTDSFYKDLEFGTGGLRGIMGVGSNRMNKYTVGTATQGLCNYLKKAFGETPLKVAVAHDSRNQSRDFAVITADIFSSNGIEVYLFESLRPTPELSFAIRKYGCQSGVVVTASHNPKEYNGYKAYWSDGAQLIPPHDKNVIAEVQSIDSFEEIKFQSDPSLIHSIGQETDDDYLDMIKDLSLSPEVIERQKDMKIVFSSIHGTGITLVPPVLEKFGFDNVHVVEEQAEADGNFPTVIYPNPEEAEALSLALKKAEAIDADLVMATDPDSDRVGIAVKNSKGEFQLMNGNQTAALLVYYLLKKWKENGKLTGKEFVVKTIVTTDLLTEIANDFGVKMYETLTGFKYIAELIRLLEGKEEFIGGGEESYGYLIGDKVRDKDAIASCAMIAEMAAWTLDQGKTPFELLLEIYQQHGMYLEGLKSVTKKGKSGADEIKAMMEGFRSSPPEELGGEKVTILKDYQASISRNLITGEEEAIDLPKSNVLQFFTEKGSKISVRPSGTEPKIKFYFSVKNKDLSESFNYFTEVESLQETITQMTNRLDG